MSNVIVIVIASIIMIFFLESGDIGGEIEKRDFPRILIFILASNNTSKIIIVIETITITITITLLILMKSLYPTYHNNQI